MKNEFSEKEQSAMRILKGEDIENHEAKRTVSIFEAMSENPWLEENSSKISFHEKK